MFEMPGPNCDISDIDRVNQLALESGKFGKESSQSLKYGIYFDTSHAVIGLQRLEGPEIPEVESALHRIRTKCSYDRPAAISFYLPLTEEQQQRIYRMQE